MAKKVARVPTVDNFMVKERHYQWVEGTYSIDYRLPATIMKMKGASEVQSRLQGTSGLNERHSFHKLVW